MSEIWMYGPDYADDDDEDDMEEDIIEEEEEDDYFELPPIITTTLPPSPQGEEGDDKKRQRLDITITMKKIEAESPLLPNREYSLPEANNNNVGSPTTPTLTPPTIITTTSPTDQLNTSKNISSLLIPDLSSNSPTDLTPSPQQAGRKRFSIPNLFPGNNRKLSIDSITQPIQSLLGISEEQCRRRNSQPNLRRFRSRTDTGCSLGHRRGSRQLYSKSPTRKHSHNYNLYPKDSFYNLEGKAPKQSNKMQAKVDAVGRVTGEWGKWQLRTVLLIFLCKIPSSWFMACIIFTAPAPRHGEFFCKPPPQIGAKNQTAWIKVSHPIKEEVEDQEFSIDFCNVYKDAQEHVHHYYNYAHQSDEPKAWEEPESLKSDIIPCKEFMHEAEFHSVITQYDLVCSRDILVSVTQFFHLFGVLTGGILANHLLKYFSPRSVMLFGMITQIFCGNLTGHVASYELHVFFRCLSAVCCAQMYTAGGMIMADITGGIYKTCVSTLFEQFWSIGVILLPGVASFFSSWSYLYMAISWPTVILIYLWRWIPDSPRWMVARGRVMEAKQILIECAEYNGTRHSLPHDIDQQLELQAQTAMDAPPPAGWWSIWKGEKAIRHMVCVHLCWSIYIVVYYGMLLNIRSFSREHLQINTVIAGLSEIIGTFIGLFLILKTKRKWVWTGLFNVVAGCIAYMGWLVPQDIPIDGRVALLMLTAMISKMAISCTLSILTTCTVELVSNEKKKICAFSTICWARFWLLGAPFIGATIVFGQLVPQTAFASLAIVGGFLSSFISSPRTVPKRKTTQATNNMATATQLSSQDGIDNKAFSKGLIFSSISSKFNNSHSNLPPQLMPGIWTTKSYEDAINNTNLPKV
ncbi:organic cation transporter-like protein isoform X2 [Stomoxys calcitrans]|uniref:Major facilitator superfamily (MFS) profile domain-containing protein n=1 Tax=Stomoxys calcitrans TaxID=35570 RepID=A0A1I8NWY7_STOCA|nr:organic cation transporter-like protein isoform X2 [Stomoxys calcitrans]